MTERGPKELDQEMKVGTGKTRQKVEANFEAKENPTIRVEEPEPDTKVVKPGLTLLRVTTDKG